MNNVLLWLGGLLVAVLGAMFAVPHFVDWTSYRGMFEEEASRVLGREVRVAGAVNLRLLPTPYVRFEKVRLSDVAGQTGEPFFRADDFTLWLSPGPLLRGAVEARHIELRRPTLKLRLSASGGGNWQTLSITPGSLPFVPSDIALQSVQITDGTVSIDGPDQRELLRSGPITGELSAAAIGGPFRFRGNVERDGKAHEIKLSTAAFEPDGSIRFKAQATAAGSSDNLVLDGTLADLSARPRLTAQLSGVIGLASATSAKASGGKQSATGRLPVDARAIVEADVFGARLTDVNFAFEHDGKPQLIAGTADLAWQNGLAVKSAFSSRWLDLDHAMATNGAPPIEALRRVAAHLQNLLPANGSGRTSVAIDQVTLGGEALSDVKFAVERTDGAALRLTEARASLPGSSRIVMSGAFGGAEAFEGTVGLRGANLSRLLLWLGYGGSVGDARTEGSYSLNSKLAFDDKSIAIKDAVAALGSSELSGAMSYRWSDRPRLDVVLDGDQIDLGLVSPNALDLAAHIRAFADDAPPTDKPTAGQGGKAAPTYAFDPRQQDATLRIRAGRLRDNRHDFRDVDVDAAVVNGRLELRRLAFVSSSGLELRAEGEIESAGAKGRGGNLRGTVAAADEAALSELLALADRKLAEKEAHEWRSLAPASLAWSVRFGDPRPQASAAASSTPAVSRPAEIWLDGIALGRRLVAVARVGGEIAKWRQSQIELNATIERPDWQRLRTVLALEPPAVTVRTAGKETEAGNRGRLQLRLSGRPDQSLASFLKMEDEAFDVGLAGKMTLGADDRVTAAEGELQLRTADLAQSAAVLGYAARNLAGVQVEGTADLVFKDKALRILPSHLEVAGVPVGGELTVRTVGNQDRRRIEGRITSARARLPRLLDLLVDPRTPGAADGGDDQLWQSRAFDLGLIDRFEGRLRLEAAQLAVTSEIGLANAAVDVEFGPGKVDVVALDGDALGARLSSRWKLEKAPAGASLTGAIKFAGADLAGLAANKTPGQRLSGKVDGFATVKGRALSPRGLVAALAGAGEIEIAGGQVAALSPAALRVVSVDVIEGRRDATAEEIEKGVAAMLADTRPQARLDIGNRKLPFDISDGALRLRPYAVETSAGRATNRSTIDLARLMIDAEWKLEQKPEADKTSRGKTPSPLPAVSIVFVGPLSSLGQLPSTVSVDALTRELVVRRMEHDVEKLELLRRQDEERAKQEAERQKAEADARAATAAAAAAAASMSAQPLSAFAPEPSPLAGGSLTVVPPSAGAVPQVGTDPPAEPAQEQTAPATTAEPAADQKRRLSSPTGSQVPSSQRLKGSSVQDVFRRQSSGGN